MDKISHSEGVRPYSRSQTAAMDDSCATCSTRLGSQPSKGVKVRILEVTLLAFMLLQKSTVIGENRCRGLSPLCLYKLGRVHLRYPARCEADARPGHGEKRDNHYGGIG
jgi:hypothetical protein